MSLAIFVFLDLSIVFCFNDINLYNPLKNKQFPPSLFILKIYANINKKIKKNIVKSTLLWGTE